MKQLMIIFAMLSLSTALAIATPGMVDDFNNANGDITESSLNDQGNAYYAIGAETIANCDYLNQELYCSQNSPQYLANLMNVSAGEQVEFDIKCDAGQCNVWLRDTSNNEVIRVEFNSIGNLFVSDGVGTTNVGSYSTSQYYHVTLQMTGGRLYSLYLNDTYIGTYTSTSNRDTDSITQYSFRHDVGASLYLDNLEVNTIEAPTTTTVSLVDDFNEANGAITSSSTNDQGNNYQALGEGTIDDCDYLNQVMYCSNVAPDMGNNLSISTDEYLEFDAQCDAGICYVKLLESDRDEVITLRIEDDGEVHCSNGEGTSVCYYHDTSRYHHYMITFNDTTTYDLYVDGIYVGQFGTRVSRSVDNIFYYAFDHDAGLSLYLDNLTITEEYVEPLHPCLDSNSSTTCYCNANMTNFESNACEVNGSLQLDGQAHDLGIGYIRMDDNTRLDGNGSHITSDSGQMIYLLGGSNFTIEHLEMTNDCSFSGDIIETVTSSASTDITINDLTTNYDGDCEVNTLHCPSTSGVNCLNVVVNNSDIAMTGDSGSFYLLEGGINVYNTLFTQYGSFGGEKRAIRQFMSYPITLEDVTYSGSEMNIQSVGGADMILIDDYHIVNFTGGSQSSTYFGIGDEMTLGNSWVSVEDGTAYDTAATITFLQVNDATAIPYKDGAICGAACTNVVNDGTILRFDVLDWSNYSYGGIPPTIILRTPTTDPTIKIGENQTFSISVSEPDNDTLSYVWTVDSVDQLNNASSFTFDTAGLSESTPLVEVAVVDKDGNDTTGWSPTLLTTIPYAPGYESEDIDDIAVDGIGRFVVTFVKLAAVLAIFILVLWGAKALGKAGKKK